MRFVSFAPFVVNINHSAVSARSYSVENIQFAVISVAARVEGGLRTTHPAVNARGYKEQSVYCDLVGPDRRAGRNILDKPKTHHNWNFFLRL
ncbi:MAG: hypothetical protein M5U15_08280 [Kiritimatiellae bacterium]|nr:hypothetical protein [Kiritimatiellia bacterium]MCZ7592143.1 hypothetical protein [Kiritimatiellia bacterium]